MVAGDLDPKLLHLVKKILADNSTSSSIGGNQRSETTPLNPETNNEDQTMDAEAVLVALRYKHREYQRKGDKALLEKIRAILNHQLHEGSAETPPLSRNKRKAAAEDERYEREARSQEAKREAAGIGGGLNASLRNRYRQQALSQSAPAADDESDQIANFNKKSTEEADGGEADTNTSVSAKKTPKVKRRKVKRLSSSFSESAMLGGGDGTEEAAAFLTPVPRPKERYSDLGGMQDIIQEIRQLVEYPLVRPEIYQHLGVDPPRGVLLRGPPGTGKTHLANAVAGQLGVSFFRVAAPELVTGMSGESERLIRSLFQTASRLAPAIIFMDEIDAIAPKRSEGGGSRGMEKRMVAQLLTCMDLVAPENNRNQSAVIVLAATNRPDAMDPALRRAGRFDKEILMGVPDEAARQVIISTMTKRLRLAGDFDYKVLARKTPGYVGADIRSLAKEAAVIAINRIFSDVLQDFQNPVLKIGDEDDVTSIAPLTPEQMDPLYITMADFLDATKHVQPSSKREGFATVPDVSWDDIGALKAIRDELTISVLEPIQHPEKFEALGLSLPAGVLLYGPPGCGKTLLAKAIANESGANFISVKGPELLDKYVGESERAVRQVFERARASSPCVVFFDELDSLVPKRGGSSEGGSGVSERVVNQLLTEMDGLDSRRSVFVIAATNRPELIDPAMMRPGRLDRLLYVPLPSPADRVSILRALAAKVALAPEVDLEAIGTSAKAESYSGADCAALLREAGLAVLKEGTKMEKLQIELRHFDRAFDSVLPSVTKKEQARYERIRDRMSSARSRGTTAVNDESVKKE